MLFNSTKKKKKQQQQQKITSAKKILKGITCTSRACLYAMLLYPVKMCIVPNTPHARRKTILESSAAAKSNQTYSMHHSRRVGYEKDKMYEDLTENSEKRIFRSEEKSIALSVNDNNSTNVDDPMHESQYINFNDHADDWIFEDFIRRNRERFVLEKAETANISMEQQRSRSHYVMDDWIFEDFIRRNRKRFQLEKERIISLDDYSEYELDD